MFQGFPGWDVWIDAEQALFFFAAVGEGDDADGFDRRGHYSPPILHWKWALIRTITFMAVTPFTELSCRFVSSRKGGSYARAGKPE